MVNDLNGDWRNDYKTQEWQRLSTAALERDHWTCADCGDRHEYVQAHHVVYPKGKRAYECSLENLVTLCVNCHKQRHDVEDWFARVLAGNPGMALNPIFALGCPSEAVRQALTEMVTAIRQYCRQYQSPVVSELQRVTRQYTSAMRSTEVTHG